MIDFLIKIKNSCSKFFLSYYINYNFTKITENNSWNSSPVPDFNLNISVVLILNVMLTFISVNNPGLERHI